MKLTKINLNQLSDIDLNEREMCRLLGGGIPGCCQCGCNYATSGGSSTSSNDSSNNSSGYTSDPDATTPCSTPAPTPVPVPPPLPQKDCSCSKLDVPCH